MERPGGGIALVPTEHEAARLASEVHEVVGVAELGECAGHTFDGLGHDVLVRHGHDRHVHARERGDVRRVHAARQHDGVRLDRPVVGDDAGDPPVAREQPLDTYS